MPGPTWTSRVPWCPQKRLQSRPRGADIFSMKSLRLTISHRTATLLHEALEDAETGTGVRAAELRLVRHELELEGRAEWGELWWLP